MPLPYIMEDDQGIQRAAVCTAILHMPSFEQLCLSAALMFITHCPNGNTRRFIDVYSSPFVVLNLTDARSPVARPHLAFW